MERQQTISISFLNFLPLPTHEKPVVVSNFVTNEHRPTSSRSLYIVVIYLLATAFFKYASARRPMQACVLPSSATVPSRQLLQCVASVCNSLPLCRSQFGQFYAVLLLYCSRFENRGFCLGLISYHN